MGLSVRLDSSLPSLLCTCPNKSLFLSSSLPAFLWVNWIFFSISFYLLYWLLARRVCVCVCVVASEITMFLSLLITVCLQITWYCFTTITVVNFSYDREGKINALPIIFMWRLVVSRFALEDQCGRAGLFCLITELIMQFTDVAGLPENFISSKTNHSFSYPFCNIRCKLRKQKADIFL